MRLFGIDICEDTTQITVIRKEGDVPEALCFDTSARNTMLPTVLYRTAEEQWLVCEEAEALAAAEGKEVLKDFFHTALTGNEITYEERTYPAAFLLDRYLCGLLKLLQARYPDGASAGIVFTCEEANENQEALRRFETFLEARALTASCRVISHVESFYYYVLHQPEAVWQNGALAFEAGKDGVLLYRLECEREEAKLRAVVEYENHTAVMPYELMEQRPEEAAYAFTQLAELSLHRKSATSLFVTGRAFAKEWSKAPLQALSTGRRVFKGQNLYTQGACYAAEERLCGGIVTAAQIFMPEQITAEISLRTERDGKEVWVSLAKPGDSYLEVKTVLEVIVSKEREFCFAVRCFGEKEAHHILLTLSNELCKREAPLRYELRLFFLHREQCVIQIKDLGFGAFYPTSYRIYEKILDVSKPERKRTSWEG